MARPKAVLSSASNVGVGGDSNSPSVVMSGGEVHIYRSFAPAGADLGGVKSYLRCSPTVETFVGSHTVTPDRTILDAFSPPAFGPWFEGMIRHTSGTIYAWYHTETRIYSDTAIHVKIGLQKSTDNGDTFTDLGIILDTPAGSDIANGDPTSLGYGFVGGNGDCSVILDPTETYVYLFFSQYGKTAATQGVAVARMLWSDRDSPVGNVWKYNAGAWDQPGLGGTTTPILPNVGDIHGQTAGQDYYWGPAIHFNTFLNKYVIALNHSNNGGFTWTGGQMNQWCHFDSLAAPTPSAPENFVFPSGFPSPNGNWYPMIHGLGAGDTDKRAGQVARMFVLGESDCLVTFSWDTPTISAGAGRGRSSAHV